MSEPLNIGYLASIYPRAVDTSVRNEVIMLRRHGHTIHTFSIRKAAGSELLSEFHRQEMANTLYILSDRYLQLPLAALMLLVSAPGRFFAAAALALRTLSPGVKSCVRQVAYFLEAALLARELRARGIQHLHVHIGEASASVAMLASALSGIPYSMTIHGPYIFRAPEKWALGEKIRRSSFTVCITEFTRSQCMIYVPYEYWERLHIVHCGPDPAFLENEPPAMVDAPRMVWVGRICEEKAVPVVLEAARKLAGEGVEFELVMVGDGPLRGMAEAMIAREGLGQHVRLAGLVTMDALVELVQQSKLVVLPSFAEGLPAVIMEAFAMRRPVISTYIAGIPELVEPGVNGWLVHAGSVDSLADAMREALATPRATLEAMGERGRQAVLERHDPYVEAGKIAELIRKTLAAGTAGRIG